MKARITEGDKRVMEGNGLGCFLLGAWRPERPYREEFVPAGHATIRRYSEEPPDDGCLARDMLSGDALQFQVAANSTVGIQQIPKGSAAFAKSRLARIATPRQNAADAEEIVNY